METIDFAQLFTPAQMAHVIDLWCTAKIAPNKAILAYINTQPGILEACQKHEVFPPYLSYVIEYQLSCKPMPVDGGPVERTRTNTPTP